MCESEHGCVYVSVCVRARGVVVMPVHACSCCFTPAVCGRLGRRSLRGGQLPQPVPPGARPTAQPHAEDQQLQLRHVLLQGGEQQGRPALLPEEDTR